jgi:tight adherence protein B
MLIPIMVSLIVFGAVFYVVNLFFPVFEDKARTWEKKKVEELRPKVDRMFLDIPYKKLLLMDVLAPVVCGALGFIFTRSILIAAGCAGVGLAIPAFVVKELEKGRRRKFSGQLVDALMILSSCLKAGLSLQQSFEVLIEEMPAPMSQEFGLLLRQMKMGVSLEEALASFKKRMRVDELDMIITSMMVSRETGGDLTETFATLAVTIQERNKLIGKVNALCVQGKLQGIIMSIIPVGFAVFVYQTNPHFFDVFFKDDFGRMLMGYAVVSQLLGIVFIRKFSKVDI